MRFLAVLIWLPPALLFAAGEVYRPVVVTPPPPAREFRAAWITEVAANPDWPSRAGLTAAQQKAELISLLDRAAQLHFNAVFFQVRPACDAFYASPLEPWSERLAGTMGKPPEPFYDPLALAIAEAHQRGLELHAWLNPFRAAHPSARSPAAANHITRTHPEIIRHYASQIWLDPGEPLSQSHSLAVVMDVVKRYDVDGIVFDDYFYPYPEKDAAGRELDFPDGATWERFGRAAGFSNRDDWRRDNVNRFIRTVSQSIKTNKPWVQFGVSPFGIWRPGVPAGVSPKALDACGRLYADARHWLTNGWLDYCVPQLYWPIAQREESFPALLNWWRAQNVRGRHVFAGLNDAGVGEKFAADEIDRQIQTVRSPAGNGGEVHYHLRSVLDNPTLAGYVTAQYALPALVPSSPWLDSVPPAAPKLTVAENDRTGLNVKWEVTGEPASWWILQYQTNAVPTNAVWKTEILPADQTARTFENPRPEVIAVSAVDRLGNVGSPAAIKKTRPIHVGKSTRMLN